MDSIDEATHVFHDDKEIDALGSMPLDRRDSTSSLVPPSALWFDDGSSACSSSIGRASVLAEEWETLDSEHFVPLAESSFENDAGELKKGHSTPRTTKRTSRNGAQPSSSFATALRRRHKQSLRMIWDFGLCFLSFCHLYSMNNSIVRQDFQSPAQLCSLTNLIFLVDIVLNVTTMCTASQQQPSIDCAMPIVSFDSVCDKSLGQTSDKTLFSLGRQHGGGGKKEKGSSHGQIDLAWSIFSTLLCCLIDVMAIVPIEHWYIRPLLELERRRGFWRKTFRRTKVVSRVTLRILRSSRWIPRVFRVIVQSTSRPVRASWKGIRWSIRYLPKYVWFVRHAAGKGVLCVRFLRLARYLGALLFTVGPDGEDCYLYTNDVVNY